MERIPNFMQRTTQITANAHRPLSASMVTVLWNQMVALFFGLNGDGNVMYVM
jgi:hypothetical protein